MTTVEMTFTTASASTTDMGEMKKIADVLENMFRPLCDACGLIPKEKNSANIKYCFYCEMATEWCQCDVADICTCEGVDK